MELKGAFLAIFLLGVVGTAEAKAFPASRLPDLDLYLSNFAEAKFEATAAQLRSNFPMKLLQFAEAHAVWNDKGEQINLPDVEVLKSVSESEIAGYGERYFGRRPGRLVSAMIEYFRSNVVYPYDDNPPLMRQFALKGRFVMTGLEPQSLPDIARAFRVSSAGANWIVDTIEYQSKYDVGSREDYEVARCMIYTIGPNRYDAKRWSMLSARKISRSEMEKRLGTKNFRIPRFKRPF